jgi:hypothetical protein
MELSRAFRLDDICLVAGDTICRNVRACQRILALKMAFDSVENDHKALVCMARLAFSSVRASSELSAMGILVAICTEVKPRNVKTLFAAGIHCTGSRGVTCEAFDVCVLSVELEFRSLVIECAPLCCLPVCSRMALVTTASEFFQVRVAVARFARRKLHATVEDGVGMIHDAIVTLLALHLLVLSSQRVAGMIMRKDGRRLPSFRVVARGAWIGELTAVYVRMA